MALVAFRRIQVGKETTRGTGVAADKRLIGGMTMTNTIERHVPIDERGSLAEFRRQVDVAQMTDIRYEADATYQQILDILGMSVRGGISGVLDVGTAYNWTYTPNLASRNNQDAYTFEYGDDTQEFESVFVMCRGWELSFALGEVAQISADLFARRATTSTFTGALSNPVVNEIVANNLNVWIDGSWATLGTTTKNALVMGGVVRLNPTGVVPVKYADNSLDFSNFLELRRHLEIELEIALGTDGMTEYTAWQNGTTRAIRLRFTGPTLEGGNHTFTINAIGQYVVEPLLFGERDGQDIIRLILHTREDASGNEFTFAARTDVVGT